MAMIRPAREFRFNYLGLNLVDPIDLLKPGQSPMAINIRGIAGNRIRCRPGYVPQFTTTGTRITDIRAYTAINSADNPRFLARNTANQIYLDTEGLVTTLASSGLSGEGVSFIPFRPNQSPQSWMYVAGPADYRKIIAPTTPGTPPIAYNVGQAEPIYSPDASPVALSFRHFLLDGGFWTQAGTAGAIANGQRTDDTAITITVDPAATPDVRVSVEVSTDVSYQVGMFLDFGGGTTTVVQDVIPPIPITGLTIQSIYYFSGTTGRCIITPTKLSVDSNSPTFDGNIPRSQFDRAQLAGLRRGALIRLVNPGSASASPSASLSPSASDSPSPSASPSPSPALPGIGEVVLVLSAATGPDGSLAIETTTVASYPAGTAISGVPTIICGPLSPTVAGSLFECLSITCTLTGAGTGSLSVPLAPTDNPFTSVLSPEAVTPQPDDYIVFGLKLSDMEELIRGQIIFDVKNSPTNTPDYITDAYYYEFDRNTLMVGRPFTPSSSALLNPALLAGTGVAPTAGSTVTTVVTTPGRPPLPGLDEGDYVNPISTVITTDIPTTDAPAITSTTTTPISQWSTVAFPIRALTRIGNDIARTLANCIGVRISLETTNTIDVEVSSLLVVGGGQLDTGLNNAPYYYCFVARNDQTGHQSNPSPITRYGITPHRQRAIITIPASATTDAQSVIYDVYRYGGIVTSWRYVGSINRNTAGTTSFYDNASDSAALGGRPLEWDNHEPWPTITYPFVANAGTTSGITTTLQARGTVLLLIYSAAAPFTLPSEVTNSLVTRWLPGTLCLISGQSAYTLRTRPISVTLSSPPATDYYAYRFEFVECLSTIAAQTLTVNEPNVARQPLPYVWGPDAQGSLFACGDPYRPGTIYTSKPYNPDSAPDRNNVELTTPSEPLLGGEILAGVSLVASSQRWWALYPSFNIAGVAAGAERLITRAGQQYAPIERQVGRGLAAPYAHCTDGQLVYFVARDGIWATDGSAGRSLTDDSLYPLFPHEGVTGRNHVYGDLTIIAPDYARAALFRLTHHNGFLYFVYQGTDGIDHILVYDIKFKAWSYDITAHQITCFYSVEQPPSAGLGVGTLHPSLLLGDVLGNVWRQTDYSNDDATPITCNFLTHEYDGDDPRRDYVWNDIILDSTRSSLMSVYPLSNGQQITGHSQIDARTTEVRDQAVIRVGVTTKFIGLRIDWSDDFNVVTFPTTLWHWQPQGEILPLHILTWTPEATGFGLPGFKHMYRCILAYRAHAPVTVIIQSYDGTSPDTFTMPTTGGAYQKVLFPLTYNKGMLYSICAFSDRLWRLYLDECEFHVGAWGRQDEYTVFRDWSATPQEPKAQGLS